jgi:hypothetical protein
MNPGSRCSVGLSTVRRKTTSAALDRGELERLVAGEVADHAGLAQPKFVSEATERQAAEPLHRGVLYRALEDPPARPLCLGV